MCYGNVEIGRTKPPRRGNASRIRRFDLSGRIRKSVGSGGGETVPSPKIPYTKVPGCVVADNVRPENVWRSPKLSITLRETVDGGRVWRQWAKRYLSRIPNSPATKGLRDTGTAVGSWIFLTFVYRTTTVYKRYAAPRPWLEYANARGKSFLYIRDPGTRWMGSSPVGLYETANAGRVQNRTCRMCLSSNRNRRHSSQRRVDTPPACPLVTTIKNGITSGENRGKTEAPGDYFGKFFSGTVAGGHVRCLLMGFEITNIIFNIFNTIFSVKTNQTYPDLKTCLAFFIFRAEEGYLIPIPRTRGLDFNYIFTRLVLVIFCNNDLSSLVNAQTT